MKGGNNFYFKVFLKMEVKYNKSFSGMSHVGQRVMQKLLGMMMGVGRTAALLPTCVAAGGDGEGAIGGGGGRDGSSEEKCSSQLSYFP